MKPKTEQLTHFNNIECEINKLNGIISDILALDSFGHHTLTSRPIDLCDHLATAIDNLKLRVPSISIGASLPENKVTVKAYGGLLDQAFDNILNNAARHCAQKPIEVAVTPMQHKVTIEFRDRGTGVEEEFLEQIFAPFVRTDNARSEDRGGVGLGLALTKKIVEYHEGSIRAENNSDGGLSIIIQLPMQS